jgi:hypothetical protein
LRELALRFDYEWVPVLLEENQEYLFPEKISPYMRKSYRHPAIYRWNIFKNKPGDERLVYIGEAQQLCPQRIYGYLNPGPTQKTNQRMKEEFLEYSDKGYKIGLEVLRFSNARFGDFTIAQDDLSDKHVRRFMEELMIVLSDREGFKILNL